MSDEDKCGFIAKPQSGQYSVQNKKKKKKKRDRKSYKIKIKSYKKKKNIKNTHTHTHTKKKKFTCQDHAGQQQQQQQQMDCKLTGIHLIFFIDLGMICCSNDKSIDPVLCPLSSYCSRLNLYADEPKEFINMDQ